MLHLGRRDRAHDVGTVARDPNRRRHQHQTAVEETGVVQKKSLCDRCCDGRWTGCCTANRRDGGIAPLIRERRTVMKAGWIRRAFVALLLTLTPALTFAAPKQPAWVWKVEAGSRVQVVTQKGGVVRRDLDGPRQQPGGVRPNWLFLASRPATRRRWRRRQWCCWRRGSSRESARIRCINARIVTLPCVPVSRAS